MCIYSKLYRQTTMIRPLRRKSKGRTWVQKTSALISLSLRQKQNEMQRLQKFLGGFES